MPTAAGVGLGPSLFPSTSAMSLVCALLLPVRVQSRAAGATLEARQTTGGVIPIATFDDISYFINITLGGKEFTVLIDTGSADLWIAGEVVPNAQDTGRNASIEYVQGAIAGPVKSASLSIAGFNVPAQEFIQGGSNSSAQGNTQGLIGLSATIESVIFLGANGSALAVPPMNNIFLQNTTSQNYISLLLPRVTDPERTGPPGQMSISEPIPGYENVLKATKIPALQLTPEQFAQAAGMTQPWIIPTDVNGIIDPFGNVIKLNSVVPNATAGSLFAMIDSGFTNPQVPKAITDAMYGWIEGAFHEPTSNYWFMPCDAETNVTFVFGGQKMFVHPLDASMSWSSAPNVSQIPIIGDLCLGRFQPAEQGNIVGPFVDMILGMAFQTNVNTLFDYGDFLTETANDRGPPFIQMISTTDPVQAHADFVQARVKNPKPLFHRASFWIAIGIGLAILATCLGCCCCCIIRRRRKRAGKPQPKLRSYFMFGMGSRAGGYRGMDAPAPGHERHEMPYFPTQSQESVPLQSGSMYPEPQFGG